MEPERSTPDGDLGGRPVIHFCTYFDRNYLTRAVALHQSLVRHSPSFTLWALCLDADAHAAVYALGIDSFKPIRLADLEQADPALLEAKPNRSTVEYYFTLSPALPLHLLDTVPDIESITYLDSDLLFYSSPQPVFDELGAGSVAIVPHRYPPKLQELSIYGTYNVAWVTFRNDSAGREVLGRWRRQCLEWCRDHVEDGKFADQGYLDEWPGLPGVRVIENLGVDLAPWNFMQYRIDFKTQPPTVDGLPLVFYHFQSFKPVGPGLWDTCLDPYGKMDGALRSWLYGGYLRELRLAAAAIRSHVPSYARSDSLRRSRWGWRVLLRRIRRGQVIISPKSFRL
jgi:hypothetical protein